MPAMLILSVILELANPAFRTVLRACETEKKYNTQRSEKAALLVERGRVDLSTIGAGIPAALA